LVGRMAAQVAPLAAGPLARQDAVHRALRAQVATLIVEQLRPHGRRRKVAVRLAAQGFEHLLALLGAQGARRRRARPRRPLARRRAPVTVVGGPADAERFAGRVRADPVLGEAVDGVHQVFSSLGGAERATPSSCDTFFWTSMISSACLSCTCSRAFSACRRSSSLRWAFSASATGFRPRRAGWGPWRPALANSARHLARCES